MNFLPWLLVSLVYIPIKRLIKQLANSLVFIPNLIITLNNTGMFSIQGLTCMTWQCLVSDFHWLVSEVTQSLKAKAGQQYAYRGCFRNCSTIKWDISQTCKIAYRIWSFKLFLVGANWLNSFRAFKWNVIDHRLMTFAAYVCDFPQLGSKMENLLVHVGAGLFMMVLYMLSSR